MPPDFPKGSKRLIDCFNWKVTAFILRLYVPILRLSCEERHTEGYSWIQPTWSALTCAENSTQRHFFCLYQTSSTKRASILTSWLLTVVTITCHAVGREGEGKLQYYDSMCICDAMNIPIFWWSVTQWRRNRNFSFTRILVKRNNLEKAVRPEGNFSASSDMGDWGEISTSVLEKFHFSALTATGFNCICLLRTQMYCHVPNCFHPIVSLVRAACVSFSFLVNQRVNIKASHEKTEMTKTSICKFTGRTLQCTRKHSSWQAKIMRQLTYSTQSWEAEQTT